MAEFVSWALSFSLWIYLAAFVGLILIGFVITALSLRRQANRHREIFEFRQRFIDWVNGEFRDQHAYMQLISDSPRIQDAMGHWGFYSTFTPPYSRVVYHNWPIILNGLPQIGQNTSDYMGSGRIAGGYVNIIDEALLRALGTLDNNIKSRQGGLFNPVVLLREGLIYTLTLPFTYWPSLGS